VSTNPTPGRNHRHAGESAESIDEFMRRFAVSMARVVSDELDPTARPRRRRSGEVAVPPSSGDDSEKQPPLNTRIGESA
jgi:hypothetical protein